MRFQANLAAFAFLVCRTGLAGAAMGSIISFVPGSETPWFTCCALVISAGLVISNPKFRIFALVRCLRCQGTGYAGYQRGVTSRAQFQSSHLEPPEETP